MTARPPSGRAHEAGRLGHGDRQPAAQLGEHSGLRLEGQSRGRAPRGPHDPALAAVVVDQRDVVLGSARRRGDCDPDRVEPGHGGAGQSGERGGRAGHRSTVGRAGRSYRGGVQHPRRTWSAHSPACPSPAPSSQRRGELRADPDLLARLLAEPDDPGARGRRRPDAGRRATSGSRCARRRPRTTRRARRTSARTTRARRTSLVRPGDAGRGLGDPARGRGRSWTTGRPACWPKRSRWPTGTRRIRTARAAAPRPSRPRPAGPGSARARAASTTRAPTRP